MENCENVWRVINNNHFETDNCISSEFICTICNKILIDACNAPCGCRYCKKCITDYLNEDRRVCPGTSEICKIRQLNMNSNIQMDRTANIIISRLVVKCPNMFCSSQVELKMMENHIRICEKQPLCCPYYSLGCQEDKLLGNQVTEHLSTNIQPHTKFLKEWITNCNNDAQSLKRDMDKLRLENDDLKEKFRTNGERAENVIRENTLKIEILKGEVEVLKNLNLEQNTKIENQNQQIEQLNEQCQMKNKRLEMIEIINQNLEIKFNEISTANSTIVAQIFENTQSIENLRIGTVNLVEKLGDIQEITDRLNYGEFLWRIENWSEKRKQAQNGQNDIVYSNYFYSHKNGYKMRLGMFPDGFGKEKGTHLLLFFCTTPGPFERVLEWPFKRNVEVNLINQVTGIPEYTWTLKYPDDTENIFGSPVLIELEKISTNTALCQNNNIFIKCSVKSE